MVLKDEVVIDLGRTIAGTPSTLKALIEQWGPAHRGSRFASVASDATSNPPGSAMKVSQLKLLPPITDPKVLLGPAVNYQEHAMEMRSTRTGTAESAAAVDPKIARGIPGYWERRAGDPRAESVLLREGQHRYHVEHDGPIVLPKGRTQIDCECEIDAVIGKAAKHVAGDRAAEYIFGYTRRSMCRIAAAGGTGANGSDWQMGESRDTFAPLGPGPACRRSSSRTRRSSR